jgi:hypothetical protein
MRAVKIITTDITTSAAESTPSLRTAKLPDTKPIAILEAESIAFPIMLTHEVLITIFPFGTGMPICSLFNVCAVGKGKLVGGK